MWLWSTLVPSRVIMSLLSLSPPQKTTIVYEIVQQLIGQMQTGALQTGDRLPTERQLMEMLNVSRASVREALQTLTGMGVDQRRVWVMAPLLRRSSLIWRWRWHYKRSQAPTPNVRIDCICWRRAHSGRKGHHRLAIAQATLAERQELQSVTQRWIAACTPADVQLALHDEIHMTMARMTGNPLLAPRLTTLLAALPRPCA